MTTLLLALMLAAEPTVPVAVFVDHGEFESKAAEDLEKLAKKFKERLANGKVKRAHLATAEATIVVQFLSKEWEPTGSTTTRGTGFGSLRTTQDSAFGVYGALVVGESTVPFNLRLSPSQQFNKDNTLSGMVDKLVEDFIKRNYEKLSN